MPRRINSESMRQKAISLGVDPTKYWRENTPGKREAHKERCRRYYYAHREELIESMANYRKNKKNEEN